MKETCRLPSCWKHFLISRTELTGNLHIGWNIWRQSYFNEDRAEDELKVILSCQKTSGCFWARAGSVQDVSRNQLLLPGLLSSGRSSVIRRGQGWVGLPWAIPLQEKPLRRALGGWGHSSSSDLTAPQNPIQKKNSWRLLFGNSLMHVSQNMKTGEPQVFKCKDTSVPGHTALPEALN